MNIQHSFLVLTAILVSCSTYLLGRSQSIKDEIEKEKLETSKEIRISKIEAERDSLLEPAKDNKEIEECSDLWGLDESSFANYGCVKIPCKNKKESNYSKLFSTEDECDNERIIKNIVLKMCFHDFSDSEIATVLGSSGIDLERDWDKKIGTVSGEYGPANEKRNKKMLNGSFCRKAKTKYS